MTTTSRSARYARWLSIPLGLAISALLVWQASYAAFSASAENNGNTWGAGHVGIRLGEGTPEPMFALEDLAPGAPPATQTVTATYTGSLDADVSLFARNADAGTADDLAQYIDLVITAAEGTTWSAGPSGEIFRGTLAAFLAGHDDFADGLTYEALGGSQQQGIFRFTTQLRADAPNSVQGTTVTVDFVAEARSTS